MNVTVSRDDDDWTNTELYNALSMGQDLKVFEICRDLTNGPFHILTIHHDTVLHMASFNKRNRLVVVLLGSLNEGQFEKLTWINSSGNTILHETTTNNETVEAAREMLCRDPSLLMMTNKLGETPLFHAARHGKTKIFKFLSDEVETTVRKGTNVERFLLRNDKSTILHVAILSQNFELAIFIAQRYPRLIAAKDGDGLTGLQLLACNPSALNNGVGNNFLKKLIYNCKAFFKRIYFKAYIDCSSEKHSRVPMFEEIRKIKHRCESAKELAKLLVENDKSWKATKSRLDKSRAKFHKFKGRDVALEKRDFPWPPDTPLLIATKRGCTDIVKEILNVYPQAVEHIDGDGRNILHVAIKYRRMDIIDIVTSMAHSIRRLRGKIDYKGYSLLHMLSVPAKDSKAEDDIRNPALILRDDLILFEVN
ncbi:hypothetical protein R6Q57_011052 [Mikania cordata]